MTSTMLRSLALDCRGSIPAYASEYIMHIVRNRAHVVSMTLEMLSKDDETMAQAQVGIDTINTMINELREILEPATLSPAEEVLGVKAVAGIPEDELDDANKKGEEI